MPEGSAPPFTPGQLLDGKYRIESILGESGLAVVLLATQTELERVVAIKLLRPRALARQDLVERFERDARLAARMKNDHVVRVHDVGACEQGPYMVMEYLEGMDLGQLAVEAPSPFDVERVVGYAVEVCDGLAEAHEMSYLHGDIRPANLFLAKRPGTPILKIISVGISGSAPVHGGASGWADSPGGGAGALAYMAPERLDPTAGVDPRGDIWSLGVVFYELLTGQRPFQGVNPAELCERIARARPVPPMSLRPDVPLELQGIVLRCLEKRPEDRWPSVGHLAHALAPFARPVVAAVVVEGGVAEALPPSRSVDGIEVRVGPRSNAPDPRRMAKTIVIRDRKGGRLLSSGAIALAAGVVLAAGLVAWATHARRVQLARARVVAPTPRPPLLQPIVPALPIVPAAAPLAVAVEPAPASAEPDPPEPATPLVTSAVGPPPAASAVRRSARPGARAAAPKPVAVHTATGVPPPPLPSPPPAPTATDPRASFGERQ